MKLYLIAAVFALGIILLYRFYPINLFKLDISTRITNNLFSQLKPSAESDESIIILNSGNLSASALKIKIDTLLSFNPKMVGVNLCDIGEKASLLSEAYANSSSVILGNCSLNNDPLSRLIYEDNSVSHFKTDRPDYFEFRLADIGNILKERGNELERINYYGSFGVFHHIDLTDLDNVLPGAMEDKIILIGYTGDYVSGMEGFMGTPEEDLMLGYKSARITPMNAYYEYEGISPDMYDIQISANIIRMINERNFINEVGTATRIGFILFCTLLLVFLITLIRTRWLLLNLLIYFTCYMLIIMAGTFLIVLAFDRNYYLDIPELSIILTVAGVFTILYNLISGKEAKQAAAKTDSNEQE
jgi:hypothetical protein